MMKRISLRVDTEFWSSA